MPSRAKIFAGLCVIGAATVAGFIYHAKTSMRAGPSDASASTAPATDAEKPERIYFRYNGVDGHYGNLAYVEPKVSMQPQFAQQLRCEVVHASSTRGICLTADRGVVTTYTARLFDTHTLAPYGELVLKGIPSRARVAVDGSIGAFTVFVTGHGYTSLDFSTQTLIVDLASGQVLGDLETFKATRNGEPFSRADFNYWGVTFTQDAKRFFATLSTDGKHYLVTGDVASRSVKVIHENVECPSLSPDERRVAYKKRFVIDGRIVWQLHVLDLETDKETALSEKRSIDDQLEWLDSSHVLYTVPESESDATPSTSVWLADADGTREPHLYLPKAYSPAVVHSTTGS